MKHAILIAVLLGAGAVARAATSPNGRIIVEPTQTGLSVAMSHDGAPSAHLFDIRCAPGARLTENGRVDVDYTMPTGKRSRCMNAYTDCTVAMPDGSSMPLRVYNDGVAWLPDGECRVDMDAAVKNRWLQSWTASYEDFFPLNPELQPEKRIAYPALFEYGGNTFVLLTESGLGKECAASSLYATEEDGTFMIRTDGPGQYGWQTAIAGSLADVVESTLVTDNSAPCAVADTSWVRPGAASWVYWAYNHGSKEFPIVKKYIDMAAQLNMPYVLIDAEWDEMPDSPGIEGTLAYAAESGVAPFIWYNSSVGWINGAPGPKFRLNDPADRDREFAWCAAHGIKGVKIDFFAGDTNANLRYMLELLESAAKHRLMVNFHGVTLPRGWQRTYPHLMTLEGVYGAEWYNNLPVLTDRAAAHNATLPFTRNVVGSMDYTPCAFSDSQHPHITTDAHELALTILFESGLQHIADRPESILAQPQAVQSFLGNLPTAWDDTRLLGGYPGRLAVVARRKGATVYIAGINGLDSAQTANIDISRMPELADVHDITMFADKGDGTWLITSPGRLPDRADMLPRGGFLITAQLRK